MRVSHLVASLLAGTAASASFAASITVNNPSFEDAGSGVPSWGSTGGSDRGVYDPGGMYPSGVPDGLKAAYLYNTNARIYQSTSETLTAGRIYEFSIYMGRRSDTAQPRTIISILPASELSDFLTEPTIPDTGVGPWSGATTHLCWNQVETNDVPARSFVKYSAFFDTTAPSNAALVAQYAGENLVLTATAVTAGETDLDLASFSYTEVPEPTALALAAPVVMALLRRRQGM